MMARILVFFLRLYQWTLSPLFRGACRFQPSCSEYFIQALTMHGAWRGTCLGLRRLMRCRPFGGSGWDPVPPCSSSSGRLL